MLIWVSLISQVPCRGIFMTLTILPTERDIGNFPMAIARNPFTKCVFSCHSNIIKWHRVKNYFWSVVYLCVCLMSDGILSQSSFLHVLHMSFNTILGLFFFSPKQSILLNLAVHITLHYVHWDINIAPRSSNAADMQWCNNPAGLRLFYFCVIW